MALSLAAVRFLIAGAPSLRARFAAPADASRDADAVARASIEVIQTFTKAITHHVDFLNAVAAVGDQPGGTTFGRLVLFAKFI